MMSNATVSVRYGHLLLIVIRLCHGLTQATVLSAQTHSRLLVFLSRLVKICVLLIV